MYIMTQDGMQIIASEYVQRFCISSMPDCDRIVASYYQDASPVTIARYAKSEDVKSELFALLKALESGSESYFFPPSILQAEKIRTHDARIKRKGGS